MSKFKSIIVLVILLLSVKACKPENQSDKKDLSDSKSKAQELNDKDIFELEIKYKISKDDVFQVFYTNSDQENFSPKKTLRNKVSGSRDYTTVSFKLPKGEFPRKIRIDLGENKKQNRIAVENIQFRYNGKEINIEKELLPHFFVTNKFLDYNSSKGVFRSSIVNDRYDPFIISSALLIKKIEIEFNLS